MAKKSKMDDVGDKLDKLLEFMMADAKSTKADRTKDKGEKTEKLLLVSHKISKCSGKPLRWV